MPEIVLELNGEKVTVSDSELTLPDGYKIVSEQEIGNEYVKRASLEDTHVLKADFDRRYMNWTPVEKAHEIETVVSRVLAAHHKDVPNLEDAKKTWKTGEYDPLYKKYEGIKASLVKKEVLANAKGVFSDEYTSPPPTGGNTWVENALESRYEFSEEYGYPVTVLNGSPVPSSNPTANRPYRSVEEDMEALIKEDAWKAFAKKPPKGGGGSGSPGGSGSGDSGSGAKGLDEMTEDEIVAYYGKHGSDGLIKLS